MAPAPIRAGLCFHGRATSLSREQVENALSMDASIHPAVLDLPRANLSMAALKETRRFSLNRLSWRQESMGARAIAARRRHDRRPEGQGSRNQARPMLFNFAGDRIGDSCGRIP